MTTIWHPSLILSMCFWKRIPFTKLWWNLALPWNELKVSLRHALNGCVTNYRILTFLEVFYGRYNVDVITDCQDQVLLQFNIIKSSSTKFSVLFCSKDNLMSFSCSYRTISLMEHFCFRIKVPCLSKMHLNPVPRLSLTMLWQLNNSFAI